MDLFSIWHWLIVGAVLLLLFGGRGKISEVMGDVGKGIKAFKTGITDSAETQATVDTRTVGQEPSAENEPHAEIGGKA
jgi:sec-independent protein translocase protein TatA